jgi:hypothetical protein
VSILDIGCGDGATISKMDVAKKYGVEKSQILMNLACSKGVAPLASDFYNTSLIDKAVDYIFCNPPYSEYAQWMARIMKEGNAKIFYFVVPKRWRDNAEITAALEEVKGYYQSLGLYDFLTADRAARAEVEVVAIRRRVSNEDIWKQAAREFIQNSDHLNLKEAQKQAEEFNKQALVAGEGGYNVKAAVASYYSKYVYLLKQFALVQQVDLGIFKSLGVELPDLAAALKNKLDRLKTEDLLECVNSLTAITDRLTSSNRESFFKKIHSTTDFTEKNIHNVAIWAISNCNKLIDEQIVDLFYSFTTKKQMQRYKSNQKVWADDGWRFNREKESYTHYKLDYRIILEEVHLLGSDGRLKTWSYHSDWNPSHKLTNIGAVAYNLGYKISIPLEGWRYSANREIYIEGTNKVFMSVKCFKNGNAHIKFCQEFIQRFNIAVAKILKWVRNKEEAAEETGYSKSSIDAHYDYERKLSNTVKLLS